VGSGKGKSLEVLLVLRNQTRGLQEWGLAAIKDHILPISDMECLPLLRFGCVSGLLQLQIDQAGRPGPCPNNKP